MRFLFPWKRWLRPTSKPLELPCSAAGTWEVDDVKNCFFLRGETAACRSTTQRSPQLYRAKVILLPICASIYLTCRKQKWEDLTLVLVWLGKPFWSAKIIAKPWDEDRLKVDQKWMPTGWPAETVWEPTPAHAGKTTTTTKYFIWRLLSPLHWRPPLQGGGGRGSVATTYSVADDHQARTNVDVTFRLESLRPVYWRHISCLLSTE